MKERRTPDWSHLSISLRVPDTPDAEQKIKRIWAAIEQRVLQTKNGRAKIRTLEKLIDEGRGQFEFKYWFDRICLNYDWHYWRGEWSRTDLVDIVTSATSAVSKIKELSNRVGALSGKLQELIVEDGSDVEESAHIAEDLGAEAAAAAERFEIALQSLLKRIPVSKKTGARGKLQGHPRERLAKNLSRLWLVFGLSLEGGPHGDGLPEVVHAIVSATEGLPLHSQSPWLGDLMTKARKSVSAKSAI